MRRWDHIFSRKGRFVSIHAPSRGATSIDLRCLNAMEVSIHAPSRGATLFHNRNNQIKKCFNPRTLTGCDETLTSFLRENKVFQSTHPHGVRLIATFVIDTGTEFQSTHPHGVRRPLATCQSRMTPFQSTHPHGVRLNGF